MANKIFDALVIGGGIIGVSTAYQLARRGLKQVAILEKGPHVASGSTGQSSAVVRQRYANLELVQLSYASVQMFHNWCERLELTENHSGFMPVGVVWLPNPQGEDHSHIIQQFEKAGAVGGLYDVKELKERYASLNFCTQRLDMAGRLHDCDVPEKVFYEPDGGCADPQGTTEDLLEAGKALGVQLFTRHEVVCIETADGGGIGSVRCSNGEVFNTKLLLNAAGPWCGRINQMLGVTLPMNLQPIRVQIATRDRPADVTGEIPVFVSPADEIYGRPEGNGKQFIVGSLAPEDEREAIDDPDDFDTHASLEFRENTMHKLHHRFAMKTSGAVRGYAALYTVNTDDWHPIIDAIGPEGYFVANGFSGHGFKLGPSIGALIARMMTGLELPDDPSVDAKYFRADRPPIDSSGGVLA